MKLKKWKINKKRPKLQNLVNNLIFLTYFSFLHKFKIMRNNKMFHAALQTTKLFCIFLIVVFSFSFSDWFYWLSMNPILEALTFPETCEKSDLEEVSSSVENCECLFCPDVFDLKLTNYHILAHFLLEHKLVIADVKEIVDLKRFVTSSKFHSLSHIFFLFHCKNVERIFSLQICWLLETKVQELKYQGVLFCYGSRKWKWQ